MKQNDSLNAGSREAYRFLRLIKRNRVLHWRTQYAWSMPFSLGQRTRLLDAELDRSIIYLIFSLFEVSEAGKQKYEIAKCQSQEITLSKYVGIFLHSFYFYDNRYVE